MSRKTIKIVDGPSKFDLMTQLFVKGPRNHENDPLGFQLEDGRMLPVYVYSVEREDGSYESWNLRGRVMSLKGGKFDGWFSTKTRRGTCTIDD